MRRRDFEKSRGIASVTASQLNVNIAAGFLEEIEWDMMIEIVELFRSKFTVGCCELTRNSLSFQ